MNVSFLGQGRISAGVVFVLGLFLIGVMMCSIVFLFSPAGHIFFVKGCDQISTMVSYIIFDRGQELLAMFVVLSIAAIFSKSWQLSSMMKGQERKFEDKERRFLVRVEVDYVMRAFRGGVIRNLSYN